MCLFFGCLMFSLSLFGSVVSTLCLFEHLLIDAMTLNMRQVHVVFELQYVAVLFDHERVRVVLRQHHIQRRIARKAGLRETTLLA